MPRTVLTVGRIPVRKGVWLGVEDGASWEALAKFRSEDAAKRFLDLMGVSHEGEIPEHNVIGEAKPNG